MRNRIAAQYLKNEISIIDYLRSNGIPVEKLKKPFICPFHDDSRPSANVYINKKGYESFKCFGCGYHADLLNVVSKYEDIHDFREVINFLIEKYEIRD